MEKEVKKKTARDMQREFAKANRPSDELRGRMWLLLKGGVKGGSKGIIPPQVFGDFADKELGIQPTSLSRKLTGKDRFFNRFEIEKFKEFFGEDAMDVENFDIINGRLVAKTEEDLQN